MKRLVIYHANGENSSTYGPLCFAESFEGDLSETVSRFWSANDDHRVDVPRYKTREWELPAWISESEFLRIHYQLSFAYALAGRKHVLRMDRDAFYKFATLGPAMKFWYGWAVDNAKGAFMKSLKAQFDNWLAGKTNHPSPFSERQWHHATRFCPVYKARQITENLYYKLSYS